MKAKKFIGLLGAVAFTAGVVANLQYAWNDYGVLTNSLHVEVLAQSASGSGGGTGGGTTGGSEDPIYRRDTYDCKYEGTGIPYSNVTLAPGITIKVGKDGTWEYISRDADVRCIVGGAEKCISQSCPPLPGETT